MINNGRRLSIRTLALKVIYCGANLPCPLSIILLFFFSNWLFMISSLVISIEESDCFNIVIVLLRLLEVKSVAPRPFNRFWSRWLVHLCFGWCNEEYKLETLLWLDTGIINMIFKTTLRKSDVSDFPKLYLILWVQRSIKIIIVINIYIAQILCEYDQMRVTNEYDTN